LRLGLPEGLVLPAPARTTSSPRLVPLTALNASWLTGCSVLFERLLALPVWHTPRTDLFPGPLSLPARLAPRFTVCLPVSLLRGLLPLAVHVRFSLSGTPRPLTALSAGAVCSTRTSLFRPAAHHAPDGAGGVRVTLAPPLRTTAQGSLPRSARAAR
jgi:hypothetical protein